MLNKENLIKYSQFILILFYQGTKYASVHYKLQKITNKK